MVRMNKNMFDNSIIQVENETSDIKIELKKVMSNDDKYIDRLKFMGYIISMIIKLVSTKDEICKFMMLCFKS